MIRLHCLSQICFSFVTRLGEIILTFDKLDEFSRRVAFGSGFALNVYFKLNAQIAVELRGTINPLSISNTI